MRGLGHLARRDRPIVAPKCQRRSELHTFADQNCTAILCNLKAAMTDYEHRRADDQCGAHTL